MLGTDITERHEYSMATIKEIAALAGVSRGTVDRVLNDRGAVNPETAEKIRKIAKELDYKPNRAGLVLAAQKKRLKLGVILFSTGNPFFRMFWPESMKRRKSWQVTTVP